MTKLIKAKWEAVSFAKTEFITPSQEWYDSYKPENRKKLNRRAPKGSPLPSHAEYLRRKRERRDE